MNIADFAKGMGIHVEQYVIPSNMVKLDPPCSQCGQPVFEGDGDEQGRCPACQPLVIHATEGTVVNDPCPACGQPVPNSDLGCDCPHCGHEGQLPDDEPVETPFSEEPVVVVVTVSGGVAEVAYAPGINVVIVDYDNIDAGDSATDVLSELASEGVDTNNPPAELADTVKCLRDYVLEQKLES